MSNWLLGGCMYSAAAYLGQYLEWCTLKIGVLRPSLRMEGKQTGHSLHSKLSAHWFVATWSTPDIVVRGVNACRKSDS